MEQFIHFSSFFDEKKPELAQNENHKYNKNLKMQALSFVDEDMNKKNEIKNSVENLDIKESEGNAKNIEPQEKNIKIV